METPPEAMSALSHWIALVLELAGVAVVVLGTVVAGGLFLWRMARREVFDEAYRALRAGVGRAIVLGLEILVAADIVRTITVEPTLRGLGFLALIVAIRTFLSFAIEVEIEGQWPWRRVPEGGCSQSSREQARASEA